MKPSEFFAGLLAGDQHRGGIRCLRIFRFAGGPFESLCEEVHRYSRTHRPSRVDDAGHVTHWVDVAGRVEQYSLLNRSGRSDDFSTDHDTSCQGKWFFDGDRFPVIGRLISDWPSLVNFRLNILHSGAALQAHEEHLPFRTRSGTVGGRLRFHLPVQTNDRAELILDGLVYRLEPGVVYLVNQGCVHAAVNGSGPARMHLVWDSLLTGELFRFLFEDCRPASYLQIALERAQSPVRSEPVGPHRRLRPRVPVDEAATLAFCELQ